MIYLIHIHFIDKIKLVYVILTSKDSITGFIRPAIYILQQLTAHSYSKSNKYF